MTYLCVPIFVTSAAKAQRDIALAAEAGANMIELRLDEFAQQIDWDNTTEQPAVKEVQRLIAGAGLPCIVTCRPTWEGGQCELAEEDRLEFLGRSASQDAAYIDIELKSYRRIGDSNLSRGERAGVVASFHDFTGRPDRLYNIVAEMNATGCDVNKIVWHARSIRDNLEAFDLLKSRQKPTIAICMGEAGLVSRILARKFNGFLTFASLDKESGTAPGQVTIGDMKKLYRWDTINPATKVYGVVASPVMHSMSPTIHNAAFDRTGHDGVYLPMLVEPGYESFKAFMETFLNFEGLDLSGLSITIPHKENALRYLKEKGAQVEELAERIGAVNTIVINPMLRGMNTDYAAILDSITSAMNISREDLANYRVAVIGAGGTGRTAVAALAHYGATVVVYNRTKERADELAKEFDGKTGKVVSARMEKLCDSCCHIFINTTSVGMYPKVDENPLGDQAVKFTPETLVFDTIYNPIETKLLKQAREAGARTIGGVEMFVRQAAAQFQAWTDMPAPTDVMRDTLLARLSDR